MINDIKNLYSQGFTIDYISAKLHISKEEVENTVIKIKLQELNKPTLVSILKNALSMPKENRLAYLSKLNEADKKILQEDISLFLNNSKNNYEDTVVAIWIIGEMNFVGLSDILCKYSASSNKNILRIVYSSMGKIIDDRFIPYLKMGCRNDGIQVRMYSIKSLGKYSFFNKFSFYSDLLKFENDSRNKHIISDILESVEK